MDSKKKILVVIDKEELEQLKEDYHRLLNQTAQAMVSMLDIIKNDAESNYEKLKCIEQQLYLLTFRAKGWV